MVEAARKIIVVFGRIGISLLPLFVFLVALALTPNAGLEKQFTTGLDETLHWAQSDSFRATGFDGGYFVVQEVPPRFPFFRFFGWGAGVPIFYGTIARLLDWNLTSSVWLSLGLLALASFCFQSVAKLSLKDSALLGILLATYPSIVRYAPTTLLEILNHSLAMALAIAFFVLIRNPQVKRTIWFAVITIIIFAGMLRVTWVFLLIPAFILRENYSEKPIQAVFWGILKASPICIAVYLLYSFWSAPYPTELGSIFQRLAVNIFDGIRGLGGKAFRNLIVVYQGNIAEILMRIILAFFLGWSLFVFWRGRKGKETRQTVSYRLAILHFFNVTVVFALVLIGNDLNDWRDFRIFAPHVFLSLILIMVFDYKKLLVALIIFLLPSYFAIREHYQHDLRSYTPKRSIIEDMQKLEYAYEQAGIIYDTTPNSRWCNTVVLSGHYFYRSEVPLAFDSGFGLSTFFDFSFLNTVPRSKYFVLTDEYDIPNIEDPSWLELLVPLGDGAVYLNTSADC